MAVRNLLVKLGLVVGNAAAKFEPSGVAGQLLDAYAKHREKEQLRAELEELLRLGFGRFRAELADAMGELRLTVAAGVHGQVEAYLSQVPAAARQAARVLGDPSATTVPATVGVDDPQQLAAFLPQKPPRFTVGDSVPGLPSWKLVEPLGAGGFGEVWKAENPYSGVAAFKFFLDPTARERFTRAEAAALAEIHGKAPTDGVVKLLGAEPEQDPPWLQFEYVGGGDLSSLPDRWKGLPGAERIGVVRGLIRRLAATAGHFHNLGVVHRDLKPSNILLRPVGGRRFQTVIADFGISKIVPADLSAGPTPANSGTATIRAYTALYASPQQKKFRPADRRDDVYALGVLWYQLLRGDLTLERPGGEGWKQALARLGVSDRDVTLLSRCWDDEPDARPRDGDELARLSTEPSRVVATPPASPAPGPEPTKPVSATPKGLGDRAEDDREREAPQHRAGVQKGNALKYAVLLGLLAVGAAVAAGVVFVKAKRDEARAEQEPEAKLTPPELRAPKVDPKGKEPPKKDPAAPSFALPAGTRSLGLRPVGAPGPVLQPAAGLKVAVEVPFDKVRQVFPSDTLRDAVVVWVSPVGTGGKGQRVTVDTYSWTNGAKVGRFEFDGDGSAAVTCDVSPDGKQFAAAGPDGKVTVWSLADGAKVVDGFDPYGELGDGGKRHREDGLAAVYFTKTPGHLLTVSTAGFVHLFDLRAPEGDRKKQTTGPSGLLTAGKVVRGRNVAVDESRSVLALAAYGAVYRYDTGTLAQVGRVDLGAEVARPLALGVSVGAPGHLAFAFETDAGGKKEKGLMLALGEGGPGKPEPAFLRWPEAAGEAVGVDWSGDKVAVVATSKGVLWVEHDAESNRLYPFAAAEVPGGKALHAATERGLWYLIPDPTRPAESLLASVRWPPEGATEFRKGAADGNLLHVLRLDDKGLSR